MKQPYTYSEFATCDYRISTLDRCEIRMIEALGGDAAVATWNLFWLSSPGVDYLPGAGAGWWTSYTPNPAATQAIVRDAVEDEVLFRKLLMHPLRFQQWFEDEPDHSIYDSYDALGGDDWVKTVLRRAGEAIVRIDAGLPPKRDSNVYPGQFGRRAA